MFSNNGGTLAKHILIVDDDTGARTVLGDMIEYLGYRVSLAEDGAAMRKWLSVDKSVDLIVLDSMMPGEDSTNLALYAKGLRLPVVMISGSPDKMDDARAHNLQLLAKPFNSEQLGKAIELALSSGVFGQRAM